MLTDTDLRRGGTGTRPAPKRRGQRLGGALGNARLTSIVGATLLVLLAIEGATIPAIQPLLSVHIFVGMLLLGPVSLKLASTGYRFVMYYAGSSQYVREGPPAPLMRLLVAPVLVLSTLTLFGTGVVLLAVPHRGMIVGLHKASFIVWFGATTIHVLAYALRAGRRILAEWSRPAGGRQARLAVTGIALAVGIFTALVTYPLAHPWFHHFHGPH